MQCAEPFLPSLKSFKSEHFLVSLFVAFFHFPLRNKIYRAFSIFPCIERIDDMALLTTLCVFGQAYVRLGQGADVWDKAGWMDGRKWKRGRFRKLIH